LTEEQIAEHRPTSIIDASNLAIENGAFNWRNGRIGDQRSPTKFESRRLPHP